MRRLWGTERDPGPEMEEMLAEHAALKGVKIRRLKDLFLDHSVRWQLLTVLVTFVSLQLCGINAVSHNNTNNNSNTRGRSKNDWTESACFVKTQRNMPQSVLKMSLVAQRRKHITSLRSSWWRRLLSSLSSSSFKAVLILALILIFGLNYLLVLALFLSSEWFSLF